MKPADQGPGYSAPMRAVVFGAFAALCGWGFVAIERTDQISLPLRAHRVRGVVQAERGSDDLQIGILLLVIAVVTLFCVAQCLSAIWDMLVRTEGPE